MIDQPRTIIQASSAKQFAQNQHEQESLRRSAERWFTAFHAGDQLNCDSVDDLPVQLEAIQLPPRHSGVGSGTQIALATATALNQFFQLPTPSISELAIAIGRAQRSAIGSHGFAEGGFLVDQGKTVQESIGALDFQIDFPQEWPIVLMFPDQPVGLAGDQEQAAFEQIPATTLEQNAHMRDLVRKRIVPALVETNYQNFAEALFEYGRRSGLYFETVQGGAYNGTSVNALIDHVRGSNIPAVGQTSWGPCVFAITQDMSDAKALTKSVQQTFGQHCRVQITQADNAGALVNGQPNLLGRPRVSSRLGT